MDKRFYLLTDDKQIPNRWYLRAPVASDGREIDSRVFLEGRRLELDEPLDIPLRRHGEALDFTLGDFDMPVIRSDLARKVQQVASSDVQIIRARVEGSGHDYNVLNVTTVLRCLDEVRSDVTEWPEGDPRRGKRYRMVIEPRVDPRRVADQQIFRIAGWETALVVSDKLREILSRAKGAVCELCS